MRLPLRRVVVESSQGKAATRKFYYFDPTNPEDVHEIVAKQRELTSVHHATNNGHGFNPSNNGHSNNGVHGHAHGHNGNGLATSNGHASAQMVHVKDASQSLAKLQRLSAQLDEAHGTINKLQQYEGLYKESRMRSNQVQAEVKALQRLVAEKDTELARQYKRMEMEAHERSGLRSQFTSAVDEVRALRNELEEARQAMLELKGVIPANISLRRGRGSGSGGANDDEGAGAASPDVLSSLQGLAKQLAEGMEHEVGSLF